MALRGSPSGLPFVQPDGISVRDLDERIGRRQARARIGGCSYMLFPSGEVQPPPAKPGRTNERTNERTNGLTNETDRVAGRFQDWPSRMNPPVAMLRSAW